MKNTTAALNEYQVVIRNIKKLLKEQKISYKDLAKQLGMSESGIKKIFVSKDGSFLRMKQLCDSVGVSVYEMLQDTKSLDVTFSKRQQDEFLKDFVLFRVYWMLVYERGSIVEVQKKLSLSYKDMFKLMRKLDDLKLLKLLPNDRLQLPPIQAVHWIGQGDFINKIYKEWSRNLLESVSKPNARQDEAFVLRYLPMTPNTFKEFQLAILNLEEEFIRRSIHEMRTKSTFLRHVRWMVVADNKSFID